MENKFIPMQIKQELLTKLDKVKTILKNIDHIDALITKVESYEDMHYFFDDGFGTARELMDLEGDLMLELKKTTIIHLHKNKDRLLNEFANIVGFELNT